MRGVRLRLSIARMLVQLARYCRLYSSDPEAAVGQSHKLAAQTYTSALNGCQTCKKAFWLRRLARVPTGTYL